MLLALVALLSGASAVRAESPQPSTAESTEELSVSAPENGSDPGASLDAESESQKEEIAEQADLQADEDPLAQQQAEQQLEQKQAEETGEPVEEPEIGYSLDPYASARLRYRYLENGEEVWGDGGSRVGLRGRWNYQSQKSLLGLVEYGFDLLDSVDRVFNPGGTGSEKGTFGSFFPRLFFVGWESTANYFVVGKNWSAYYQVAGWTDRMQGAGGSALGVYNAQTDGGPTGTGRADSVLQTRLAFDFLANHGFEPFKINFQIQKGRPIPQAEPLDYGLAMGASTVIELENGYSMGLAVNYAQVDDVDSPEAQAAHLRGDAQAYTLGLRKFTEDWYVALGVARLLNHDTTDQGIYFYGWGGEFYAHRRVTEKVWLAGGINVLQPDSDQSQAQDYETEFGLIELRYSFRGFKRMLFTNYRLEQSRSQSGVKVPNTITIGVRWDFP